MSDGTAELMSIGRFSSATRLSIKALRLYDEMGLLNPVDVDGQTGYRYYRLDQADRAEAIRILRGLDMPLEEIMEVLNAGPEISSQALAAHGRRLSERLARDQRRLSPLEELIDGRRQLMPSDVTVEQIPDTLVASTRAHVSLDGISSAIERGFGTLVKTAAQQGANLVAPPFIIYHDVIDQETEGEIEMCVPVDRPIESSGEVAGTTLSGGPAATTVHKGPTTSWARPTAL